MAENRTNALLESVVPSPSHTAVANYLAPPRHPRLTPEEMSAVVARNNVGSVHHVLGDGAVRTNRVRYVHEGNALYIPAWTRIESWYAARLPTLQCDISEVDWTSCWRYVSLRGPVTPLHPTGAAREREAWRKGIAILRPVIVDMPPMDELAVTNFGIVRMDIESWDGAVVLFGDLGS